MERNIFVTETDEKYGKQQSYKGFVIVFSLFSLLSCLGFLATWKMFLFLEGITVIAVICTLLQGRKKSYSYRLEFENDTLTIVDLKTNKTIFHSVVPASDLVISQSKKEIQKNYCGIMIKSTAFIFIGVKNHQQLNAYIQGNCPAADM